MINIHTMDYFAEDTKGKGNLYELIANYLQDTCRKKNIKVQNSLCFIIRLGKYAYINI